MVREVPIGRYGRDTGFSRQGSQAQTCRAVFLDSLACKIKQYSASSPPFVPLFVNPSSWAETEMSLNGRRPGFATRRVLNPTTRASGPNSGPCGFALKESREQRSGRRAMAESMRM